MTQAYQDGNAMAGPLSDVFAVDVTAAIVTCAGCARRDRMATLHVYGGELGVVARCPGCDAVVLRYARGWLDLRGAVSLQLSAGDSGGD